MTEQRPKRRCANAKTKEWVDLMYSNSFPVQKTGFLRLRQEGLVEKAKSDLGLETQ